MTTTPPKNMLPMVVSFVVVGLGLATAVVVEPTVFECKSADSFGLCLREGLAERGILPPVEAGVVTEVATAAPEMASTDVSDVEAGSAAADNPAATDEPTDVASAPAQAISAAPEMSVVPEDAETAAAAPEAVAPSGAAETVAKLDIVRAEPDGSTVIAGSGTPGETVAVYASGELIGETKVEPSGDWVLVPEEQLPTGGVEISIAGAEDEKSVVVVIQEDRSSAPLVVATAPGAASKILQSAKAEQAAATPVAPAKQAVEPEQVASAPAAEDATEQVQKQIAPNDTTQAALVPVVPPTIDAIEIDGARNFFAGSGKEGANVRLYVDDQYVADGQVKDGRWLIETQKNVLANAEQRVRLDMLQTGSSAVAARAEVNFQISLPASEAADTAVAETEVTETEVAKPDVGEPETARVEPEQSAAATATPVEAAKPVEQEPMQADKQMAMATETKAADAQQAAKEPIAQINATASDNANAQLANPPAVAVEAPEAPTAMADDKETMEVAAADSELPAPVMEKPADPVGDEAPMSAEMAKSDAPKSDAPKSDKPMMTETAKPQTTEPAAAKEPSMAPAAPAKPETEKQARAPAIKAPKPNAPAAQPPAAKVVAAPSAPPANAPAAPEAATKAADQSIPTLTARPVGDPRDNRFASGNAIIRRGDNLWTIARRVYGSGLRYTAIYDANQSQIRDPALIYPGQVFDLPEAE